VDAKADAGADDASKASKEHNASNAHTASKEHKASKAEAEAEAETAREAAILAAAAAAAESIPRGDFRRHCNTCKQPYEALHRFYHQLCPACGDFNLQKRTQTADLAGFVCIVTGGRIRIGYEIVLKLLRAGATVLATSR
jgi:hypothetical protein